MLGRRRQESPAAKRLRVLLEENRALQQLEDTDPEFRDRLRTLQAWQCRRLEDTHADMAANPRYAPGIRFFIEDLYAPRDFSDRDTEIEQALPYMTRLLPESVLETATTAMKLYVLSRELDRNMVQALFVDLRVTEIDPASYAEAYRICDQFAERREQIRLIGELAERLEHYVRSRFLIATLRMARAPAALAGLGDLQSFLERGCSAFHHMRGSEHFVRTTVTRELLILERIEQGSSEPFAAPAEPRN